MNPYLSSSSLKARAKGQLLGKYGTLIGAFILVRLCTVPFSLAISYLIGTDTVVNVLLFSAASFLLQLFNGFFLAGEAYLYLKTACGQHPVVNDVFHCFQGDTAKILKLQAVFGGIPLLCSLPVLLMGLALQPAKMFNSEILNSEMLLTGNFSFDPTILLIYVIISILSNIITIYVNLMLSQIFYLMLDFPEYTASQLLKMSIRLMKGNKGRLFYIRLSFIPLILLGLFSFGLAILWIYPYMQAVYANFYLDLIQKKKSV